jgi:ATP phosphoribosyltransferase regulatory subunit HisZ
MIDAQTAAQSWAAGISNAQTKMEAKVRAVTQNPAQQAVANAGNWQAAVSSPQALAKYKANLGKVQLGDWQTAMINKGIPNAVNGARQSVDKFAQRIAPVLAFADGLKQRIRAMPSGPRGSAQRQARMNAWFQGMGQYRKS